MDALFQSFGVALVCCVVCWAVLPKPGMATSDKWPLFWRLVAAFMALHYAGAAIYAGGVNIVITAVATYMVGRWVLLPR